MSRNTPDQIIAHVDLLRAVDRLLEQAQVVRQKRATLKQLLTRDHPPPDKAEITDNARKGAVDGKQGNSVRCRA